jgi:hypothetical protein
MPSICVFITQFDSPNGISRVLLGFDGGTEGIASAVLGSVVGNRTLPRVFTGRHLLLFRSSIKESPRFLPEAYEMVVGVSSNKEVGVISTHVAAIPCPSLCWLWQRGPAFVLLWIRQTCLPPCSAAIFLG